MLQRLDARPDGPRLKSPSRRPKARSTALRASRPQRPREPGLHSSLLLAALVATMLLGACRDSDSKDSDARASAPTLTSDGAGSQSEQPRDFGEPNDLQIRPGVLVQSDNGSCTSNFLYYTSAQRFFIGAAAHCFSPDTNSGIDPCEGANAPLGSSVEIENARHPGTLAYSSWIAMQERGETPGSNACTYNDFALVEIDPRDLDNVHPAAIFYGGPTGRLSGLAAVGDAVYTYGQSPFHVGVQTLQTKEGEISAIVGEGWSYSVVTDNPGLSGDSGSAVLHESGATLGILATVGLGLGPIGQSPVVNGVTSFERAVDYAQPYFGGRLRLATWPVTSF